MKRSLIAVVTAMAMLLTAVAAEAVIRNGSYSGKTDRGLPTSFKVTTKKVNKKKRKYVVNHAIKLHFDCTDGDQFDALAGGGARSLGPSPKGVRFRIKNGKFGFTATRNDGAGGYRVQGTIGGKNSKASGYAEGVFKFNEQNQLDPNGSITCTAARQNWTAARPK
jgi:opacity protein-like surface antigen